ncbi:hypothetical protein TSTA_015910 [Talaromyces stipitatus ATCC 10500]|uniref:Uncharacterized protein n=1 Tax=Talaromyces stipitatus (strain ATCC 10500 / CBS 375.48 / QM 6759 / NRRL 1006) TaxID=441959 RepID=B8ME80_TALSN|nr:uncharacterized protein TSTA_015910 [Talaromyces stipitatus ATCC 10500]EED16507.1 hypothetical protein TSTA_015910 [Talaromyces stipitatus ATCC 10500]
MDADWDLFDRPMAGYDPYPYRYSEAENLYTLSTLSYPTREASGMDHMFPSSSDNQISNNGRYILHSPQGTIYEEEATPMVISPRVEEDIINMQRQESYIWNPDTDYMLGNPSYPRVPDHRFNAGYSSPWNPLQTESGHENTYLAVPGNRGRNRTARSPVSTANTPYTPSSLGSRSEADRGHARAGRRRGGREQGMRLAESTVQNVRECSGGSPCDTCAKTTRGRKWAGCIRSFKELTNLLNPDILSSRLRAEVLTRWITANTLMPRGRNEFELPLSFGFGKPFIGFRGIEYDPRTSEALWTYTIGQGDTHSESALYSNSLFVYPVNSSSREVQKEVCKWLKQILWNSEDMEDWLKKCFPGSRVAWARELLQVVWSYSMKSLNVGSLQEIDNCLLEAWMACLIVTILSLKIAIPKPFLDTIVPNLESGSHYRVPYPDTSRALNKCVKSLLFDIYLKFVKRITSALDQFSQIRPDQITDPHLCHMNCISILIMVLTCQIQTSLMDNARVSLEIKKELEVWDETETPEHLKRVEGVFKNTLLFVRHKRREWFKERPVEEHASSQMSYLCDAFRDVGERHGDAIKQHVNIKLEALRDRRADFHKQNIMRVFAFFFREGCKA